VALIGSDMIASSVYGPEEMLRRLGEAGPNGSSLAFPLALGIGVLLTSLAISYQQTIRAYPSGAGGYIVAKDNFGPLLGLIAAAALLIDYTLDVAVSVATGVQSITSALPQLAPSRVWVCLIALVVVTLTNLRGIRAAGLLLSAPVYAYIVGTLGVVLFGIWLTISGSLPAYTPPESASEVLDTQVRAIGILLLLRAFSSGAVALTGIEAMSNGVPYMKEPETTNAQRALVLMAVLFAAMFIGLAFVAGHLGVIADPAEAETVHSQVTRTLLGRGPLFLVIETAAVLMLILAVNTGFADFPRLLALMSQDRYQPGAFAARGSRLAFSNGIVLVAVLSAILLIAFQGSLAGLAPLFTMGAFLTFTMSHADRFLEALAQRTRHHVLILIGGPDRVALNAMEHILSLSGDRRAADSDAAGSPTIEAVHVTDDRQAGQRLQQQWHELGLPIELAILESPYRATADAIMRYVDYLERETGRRTMVTIVIPETLPTRWWHPLVRNYLAWRLKWSLPFRPGVSVLSVPLLLGD
jgi:amino acid transporter